MPGFSAYERDHGPCAALATRCRQAREQRVVRHFEGMCKHRELDEIRRARAHLELGDEACVGDVRSDSEFALSHPGRQSGPSQVGSECLEQRVALGLVGGGQYAAVGQLVGAPWRYATVLARAPVSHALPAVSPGRSPSALAGGNVALLAVGREAHPRFSGGMLGRPQPLVGSKLRGKAVRSTRRASGDR